MGEVEPLIVIDGPLMRKITDVGAALRVDDGALRKLTDSAAVVAKVGEHLAEKFILPVPVKLDHLTADLPTGV